MAVRVREFHLLDVTFLRIAEADLPRLRAWLESLAARRDELAESYRRQHTRHELFYLIEGKDDPVLAIVSESADLEAGAREFLNSELAIDVAFKTLVNDIGAEHPVAELVFDSRDVLPVPARGPSVEEEHGKDD